MSDDFTIPKQVSKRVMVHAAYAVCIAILYSTV